VSAPSPATKATLRRGWARQQELARESEVQRQRVESALVADFGRAPFAIEACVIEQISARMVRARRLRQQGRDDTEQSRLIAQLLRSIGLKPQHGTAPPQESDEEYLERTAREAAGVTA
jgi:hypothetical protein